MTFEDIRKDSSILNEVDGIEGVYFIYLPENLPFHLNRTTTAIEYYKGKKLLYDSDEKIEELQNRWEMIQNANEVDNRLVYIGKSINLKTRLKNFAAYGVRKSSTHRGGKILWQLTNAMEFYIEYKPCDNSLDEEKRLIIDFMKRHNGQMPIANEKI